jgi:hypothetical protein
MCEKIGQFLRKMSQIQQTSLISILNCFYFPDFLMLWLTRPEVCGVLNEHGHHWYNKIDLRPAEHQM